MLPKLKLGIPKGSLQERTIEILEAAGFDANIPDRTYAFSIGDPEIECFLLRPQEIPKYIEEGKLDLGISGDDCITETKAKVREICDLEYAKKKITKVKWVLAVPENSEIKSVKDLEGKTISTEMVNLVKDYLKKHKIKAKIEFSWGGTEVKPPRFADAIADLTETGASLRAHNLKILDTILESSTKLIANRSALRDPWKKEKIRAIAILLKGAVEGKETVSLMLHVRESKLKEILRVLPRFKKPTVRKLTGQDWCDINVSCKEKEARVLIPKLKKMGCEGIVEYPSVKIIK